jgi:hypothetical protein
VGKLGAHEIDDGDRDGLAPAVAPEHRGFDVDPVDARMVEHVEVVISSGETHVCDLRVGDLPQHVVALGEDEPALTHADLADRVEQPQEQEQRYECRGQQQYEQGPGTVGQDVDVAVVLDDEDTDTDQVHHADQGGQPLDRVADAKLDGFHRVFLPSRAFDGARDGRSLA